MSEEEHDESEYLHYKIVIPRNFLKNNNMLIRATYKDVSMDLNWKENGHAVTELNALIGELPSIVEKARNERQVRFEVTQIDGDIKRLYDGEDDK